MLSRPARSIGNFSKTPGWEELWAPQSIDQGPFYASKDSVYPTRQGLERRVLWGWAIVAPQSAQSLPRVLTFNAKARRLQQAPLEELEELRKERLALAVNSEVGLGVRTTPPLVMVWSWSPPHPPLWTCGGCGWIITLYML